MKKINVAVNTCICLFTATNGLRITGEYYKDPRNITCKEAFTTQYILYTDSYKDFTRVYAAIIIRHTRICRNAIRYVNCRESSTFKG